MRVSLLVLVFSLAGCSAADLIPPASPTPAPSPERDYDVLHGAADWSTQAYAYRGRNGEVVAFDCAGDPSAEPPSGVSSLYGGGRDGRGLFTDDSRVCWAGVYAGAIPVTGGRVYAEIRPGSARYPGGERNGVASVDWPSEEGGSFVVLGAR